MVEPNEREFEALAARGFNLIPVWREIAADLETPVSAFLKVARGDYAFLLESVQGGEKWGRYTFLGSEPATVLRARGERMDLTRPGRSVEVRSIRSPLDGLRDEMRRFRAPQTSALPRFFGGAVGFVAYDIVRYFERLPSRAEDGLETPDLYVMLTDAVLIFDNVRQTLKIVANVAPRTMNRRAPPTEPRGPRSTTWSRALRLPPGCHVWRARLALRAKSKSSPTRPAKAIWRWSRRRRDISWPAT